MNYTVTYTRKGAVQVTAPDPETARTRAHAVLTAGRENSEVSILDIIPETCEDCTRAVRHVHEPQRCECGQYPDTCFQYGHAMTREEWDAFSARRRGDDDEQA